MTTRTLTAALALAALSCSTKPPAVELFSICSPPNDPATCTFAATCGTQSLGVPAVDLDETNFLWLIVEAHNQLPNNAAPDSNRVNSNNAYLHQIDVEYEGVALPDASSAVANTVPAAGTTVVDVFPVEAGGASILKNQLAVGASREIIAKVKGKGVTGDGADFETPEFRIPVTVCRGCIGRLACGVDPTSGLPVRPIICPPNPGQSPASEKCP